MLRFLTRLFQRPREIEAKLRPVPGCTFGGEGEIELETWSDGSGSLEASIEHCGLPDGAEVEVLCGTYRMTALVVRGGYAKATVALPPVEAGPPASVGDEASFRHAGKTLYRGTFRPD